MSHGSQVYKSLFLDIRQAAVDEVAQQLAGYDAALLLQLLQPLDLAQLQPDRVRDQAILRGSLRHRWERGRHRLDRTPTGSKRRQRQLVAVVNDRRIRAGSLYRRSAVAGRGKVDSGVVEGVCGDCGALVSHERISLVRLTYSCTAAWLGA